MLCLKVIEDEVKMDNTNRMKSKHLFIDLKCLSYRYGYKFLC
jgi:hypothetical protein